MTLSAIAGPIILRSSLRGSEVERRLGLLLGFAADVQQDVLDVLGVLPHVRAPRHLCVQPRLAQLARELGFGAGGLLALVRLLQLLRAERLGARVALRQRGLGISTLHGQT